MIEPGPLARLRDHLGALPRGRHVGVVVEVVDKLRSFEHDDFEVVPVAAEAALDDRARPASVVADDLGALPRSRDVGVVVEVVDKLRSFEHDDFEVVPVAAQAALDDRAGAGGAAGDDLGALPRAGHI